MFRLYQSLIKKLLNDSSDPFVKYVNQGWGCEAPEELVSELKNLISLSAGLLKRVYTLWPKLGKQSKIRNLEKTFFSRFSHPDEFLSEEKQKGLFGYLDEAYMIALVYELLVEDLLYKKVKVYGHDRHLLKESIRLRRKAKAVIGGEVAKINMMLGELIDGDANSLSELLEQQVVA